MLHARIAERAFNTPLLVEPSKAMAFLSGLGPRILGRPFEIAERSTLEGHGAAPLPTRAGVLTNGLAERYRESGDHPFAVIDGIAVIEISGVLIHRGAWIGNSSGQTSYEGIAAQIEAAATDPAILGVALEIDSFGGEVAGVFDLADRIRALRASKPVWSFVAEHAFSAGYALASQADHIVLPRTGAVGSIGVVVMHADLSGQLDQDGVKVTLLHSGQHKIDANPYEPLPSGVRAGIQREIDGLRGLFAETVAAGRGARISPEAALATEAACYRGSEAVAAGLADQVIDLTRGFAQFREALSRPSSAPRMIREAQSQKQEAAMSAKPGTDDLDLSADQADEDTADVLEADDGSTDPAQTAPPEETTPPAAASAPAPISAPAPVPAPEASSEDLTRRLREDAAEIAEIAAQAARLGVAIDAARVLREGTSPSALRTHVLGLAAAAADSRDVVAIAPAPAGASSAPKESPIVAAAKRAASGAKV